MPGAFAMKICRALYALSLSLALVLLNLTGCVSQRYLMPSPNFLVADLEDPLVDTPPPRRHTHVELLYATDRHLGLTPEGVPKYTGERRGDLSLGRVWVYLGDINLDWATLLRQSYLQARTVRVPLRMSPPQEVVSFPKTPFELEQTRAGLRLTEDVHRLQEDAENWLHKEVRRRLQYTTTKEAFLFIHGYNTSFDDAAMTMAEMWHFSGRKGIPIIYSWPAKQYGILKGYAYDRESGEFTIFHLKQFLRNLAAVEDLERIHVIAHSRGADVLATALRELMLERRGSAPASVRVQKIPGNRILKMGHIVLVAPDIDTQVAGQRYVAENLFNAAEDFTIYSSRRDRALAIVEFIFGSNRIGSLEPRRFTEEEQASIALLPDTDFIDVRIRTDFFGHGYFHKSPEVASDLYFLLIRDQKPGEGYRRALDRVEQNFWRIKPGYPLPEALPAVEGE